MHAQANPFRPGDAMPRSMAVPADLASRRHVVLLVEDHDLVRMGVKALFDTSACVEIEWIDARTLGDALRIQSEHHDISAILLDLNLADCKGLSGLSQLLEAQPQARVLILSSTHDEFVVRQAKIMGAVGYVHKGGSSDATLQALLTILDPAMVPQGGAVGRSKTSGGYPLSTTFDRVSDLGPRHLEILELVLSGCTNQEISNSTGLSLGTVKNYVSTILLALDVKSRSHLISLFR